MTRRQVIALMLHVATTLFMTGLIWFVQVVHYPLFASIGEEQFAGYAVAHSTRTGWIVVPVMLVEMATAIWLAVAPSPVVSRRAALAGLALLVIIWISTAFVQVPRHARLASGFDAEIAVTLVATNWIRTCGWTTRSVLLLTALGNFLVRRVSPSAN